MNNPGIVIIGTGEAGAHAALELRRQGYTGSVTLIGDEKRLTYERPPLSKRVMVQEEQSEPTYVLNPELIAEHQLTLVTGTIASEIQREAHKVKLADGRAIPYEKLLLATGASPRRLALQGAEPEGLFYLRTFDDAQQIRTYLQPGKHIVLIGAGFIGLELAASARERGCEVTVIEAGPRILTRGVPQEIAHLVDKRHREAGVKFILSANILSIARQSQGHIIQFADGTSLAADAVIVGIGAVPHTKLASDCGLAIENGIKVDEYLRTSDPDIYAAGDCCSFPHPVYGGRRMRLEAWRNAVEQGTHVAENLLGAQNAYTRVPWFWSDQYEQTIQVTGLADANDKVVERDLGPDNHLYFHLHDDGRIVSASCLGGPQLSKDIKVIEMMIERGLKPDATLLKNPEVRLKTLLQES